jgi:pyridoxamine 5'-phosphate oxidase
MNPSNLPEGTQSPNPAGLPAAEFQSLRKEYRQQELLEDKVHSDPFRQFQDWFAEAVATGRSEPNAMTLATVGTDSKPTSRVVLLKECDAEGFVFYTNYHSRKGRQIEMNPQVALSFYWPELERQIRIEGRAEKVSVAESDAYFAQRPAGSQLGAIISPQSEVIPDRNWLESQLSEAQSHYGTGEIPRPAHWGGYRVIPERIEFWQGRPSRLHDRLVYRRIDQRWKCQRLAP